MGLKLSVSQFVDAAVCVIQNASVFHSGCAKLLKHGEEASAMLAARGGDNLFRGLKTTVEKWQVADAALQKILDVAVAKLLAEGNLPQNMSKLVTMDVRQAASIRDPDSSDVTSPWVRCAVFKCKEFSRKLQEASNNIKVDAKGFELDATNSWRAGLPEDSTNMEDILRAVAQARANVDGMRPFLGQILWVPFLVCATCSHSGPAL